jgi:hypothetical protein
MTGEKPSKPLSLKEGVVTTLVGPPGLELAALTAAIAISYRSGCEVVRGWEPDGLGVMPRHVVEA